LRCRCRDRREILVSVAVWGLLVLLALSVGLVLREIEVLRARLDRLERLVKPDPPAHPAPGSSRESGIPPGLSGL
jgi:hypothetical protein